MGNITKKVQSGAVSKTINYRYGNDGKTGWNNLLTGVDLDGNNSYSSTETISYDAIGNPTSYLGASLSWFGRQLKSYTINSQTVNYTYDADGLRSSKSVPGVNCTYQYVGGQLRYETRGNQRFYYYYDANGNLSAIRYYDANGTASIYFVLTNAQGDVKSIYSKAGALVASYEYDAFGNCTITQDTTGIGALNPIRYRGYYYDSETGFYYLQSRYYNPKVGRFLNADGTLNGNGDVLGFNMFAYCSNNPVMYSDPSGWCHKFLGFLWKVDCKSTSCESSRYYIAPKAVEPIGTYNNGKGNVYVVTEDQLDIMEEKEKNVVVIVDKRTASDPDMQILHSYRITKTKQQKEIAQLMLDYNTANPVSPEWNRTLDSLVKEWEIHNNVYKTGLFQINTADCDFNNADEGKGYWDFFEERILN